MFPLLTPTLTGKLVLLWLAGLLAGCVIRRLVYRLPRWLFRRARFDARQGCCATPARRPSFTLALRCPACQQSVPLLSSLPLLGCCWRSRCCPRCLPAVPIRSFPVELSCGISLSLAGMQLPFSPALLSVCLFILSAWLLLLIDWRTFLLPDVIVFPLLWTGLLLPLPGAPPLSSAVQGVVFGYLTLALLASLCQFVIGRPAMGQGDMKLFAALGGWFGWQALPDILLISSLSALFTVLCCGYTAGARQRKTIPFGSFLCGSGLYYLLYTIIFGGR